MQVDNFTHKITPMRTDRMLPTGGRSLQEDYKSSQY